jgi:hypothetical protein
MLSPLALNIRASLLSLSVGLWVYGFFFTKTHEFAFYSAVPAVLVIFDIDKMIADSFEE